MINEYALIPDIFDQNAYSNPALIEICLSHLKEAILQEAVIRDLGNGRWSAYCLSRDQTGPARFHRLATEILKKLRTGNRLHPFRQLSGTEPSDSEGWCQEALQTHKESPLTGIIAARRSKEKFSVDDLVASIERLTSCNWWQSRSSSVLLDRKTKDYLNALTPLLNYANSFMFIDPNLDPTNNYTEFYHLLSPLQRREPAPTIELHRSFCFGDGPARKFLKEHEWRERFSPLDRELGKVGLLAEVYLWQDFHGRYLITDLIGLVVDAGFDATATPNDLTTWARLGRVNRDRIQRLYDPGAHACKLKYRFKIGKT